jgi:ubiquitin carboxyl-terminal hydrolase 10
MIRIKLYLNSFIFLELISPLQRSKLKDRRSYKLFAVEYHHGDKANGGHYITDVYHPGIIGWVRYNDANVTIVGNPQVTKLDDKKLTPYLLYYRRVDLI